jgi:hypothetical protein
MKANELRIGNYVNVPGIYRDISEVLEICEDRVNLSGLKLKFHAFYPIPLTEEWLVRFGFDSNHYQDRYENDSIHIECNKTRGFTELWIERMPHIKSIHQLQNLYFALTGEELKLNDK